MEPVFIIGTSGFAREVADIVAANGGDAVYVAATQADREAWVGPETVILEEDLETRSGFKAAMGIGENALRRRVATKFESRCEFVNLVHPDASFGVRQREAIERKRGVIVCAGVRFTNNITVGDFTIFNLNATIGHDAIVEDFVNIAPGANISGNVHLKQGVWLGTGAAINQGKPEQPLVVGENTMIGSGSVVVKDCDADSVYVGIPAKKRP